MAGRTIDAQRLRGRRIGIIEGGELALALLSGWMRRPERMSTDRQRTLESRASTCTIAGRGEERHNPPQA